MATNGELFGKVLEKEDWTSVAQEFSLCRAALVGDDVEFYKILEANNIQYEVACTLVLLATNQY